MPRIIRRVVESRTDGARALDRYLREQDRSVPAFCSEHALDRLKIQRLLSGLTTRCDVELALKIESITGGAVAVSSWSLATLRSDEPGEFPEVDPAPGSGPDVVDSEPESTSPAA